MALTYPVYQQPCGWQAQLVPRCPEPRLRLNLRCDLAVVGAGFTGLAAARTWAERRPETSVALLDASIVGEGGSGRGAGFLLEALPGWGNDSVAAERVARRDALLDETAAWLGALIANRSDACGVSRTGFYRAGSSHDRAAIEAYRISLDAARRTYESLDANDLECRLGTAFYTTGLFVPDGFLVQPAALLRGLADSLPVNVTLYEETPALAIRPEGGGWRIECPDGSLLARRLVLANNACIPRFGIRAGGIAARYFCAALTAPLNAAQLASLGQVAQWGLLPARRDGVALRRTIDGRLLVCALRGRAGERNNSRVVADLRDSLAQRFPQLGVEGWLQPFEHVWDGAVGCTRGGTPVWGEVRPGLFVACTGDRDGALFGMLLGRLLARRALGDALPDVDALLGRAGGLSPGPLRGVGLALRSLLLRRRDRNCA